MASLSHARQRSVDHHPPSDAIRMQRRERIPDHVADVVGDEIHLLDSQLVEHADEVRCLVLLLVTTFGMPRESHSAQVGGDHGVVFHEPSSEGSPHVVRYLRSRGGDAQLVRLPRPGHEASYHWSLYHAGEPRVGTALPVPSPGTRKGERI